MFNRLRSDIDSYTQGKTWYWYILPWLFGLYLFVKLLGFSLNKPLPFFIAIAHSFDFMLHEMSHILTAFLPAILTALSGSFSELLLGGLLVFGAFKTKSYFASLFCFLWLMLACFSVAAYIGDARAQELQLVSLGNGFSSSEGVIHDWNFILGELGLLNADTAIAGLVWFVGLISGIIGLCLGAYLIFRFANAPKASSVMSDDEAMLLNVTSGKYKNPPGSGHYKANASGQIYGQPTKGPLAEHANPEIESKDKSII